MPGERAGLEDDPQLREARWLGEAITAPASRELTRLAHWIEKNEQLSSVSFVAHADEGAMLQVPSIGPFDEGDLADQLRFDPGAFFHFFCGQHLSPSRGSLLGQIGERAMRSSGFLEHWEDLLPNPRDPAGGVGPIFYIFSGISLQRFDGCHSKTFSDRRCLSTRMYILGLTPGCLVLLVESEFGRF